MRRIRLMLPVLVVWGTMFASAAEKGKDYGMFPAPKPYH